MPAPLPSFAYDEFASALAAGSPEPLAEGSLRALYEHYRELDRWNRTLSLVGPGTAAEVLSRHYGESLAALPLLPEGARELVDVGSGAGFPGLVLAAARPELAVTLVEARERKWSFLQAAARRASLPCRCLNARVTLPLPAGLPQAIDVVTVRALKLGPNLLAALASRMGPRGRFVLWVGEEVPELPEALEPVGELPLPGSDRRRILAFAPRAPIPARKPR